MSNQTTALTTLDQEIQAAHDEDKALITTHIDGYLITGQALLRIRERKSFLSEHETFEDFCLANWGFGRRRANQYIQLSSVDDPRLNAGQANEILKVPTDQREAVLHKAQESNSGKLTAKAIVSAAAELIAEVASTSGEDDGAYINESTEPNEHLEQASAAPAAPKPPPPIPTDKVGVEIPDHIQKHFEIGVAHKYSEIMGLLQTAKERAKSLAATPHGAHLNLVSLEADITNAYRAIKAAKPYAVCCYCGGKSKRGCQACKSQGFLGETTHKAAPKENKTG